MFEVTGTSIGTADANQPFTVPLPAGVHFLAVVLDWGGLAIPGPGWTLHGTNGDVGVYEADGTPSTDWMAGPRFSRVIVVGYSHDFTIEPFVGNIAGQESEIITTSAPAMVLRAATWDFPGTPTYPENLTIGREAALEGYFNIAIAQSWQQEPGPSEPATWVIPNGRGWHTTLEIVPDIQPTGGGEINLYDGSSFISRPVRVWSGSEWVVKPVRYFNGSEWVETP